MKPEEFIEIIDQQYQKGKLEKISRFSVEWGKWSRDMNLELRGILQSDPPTPNLTEYKYVFNYWILTSQLLEVHFKRGFILKKGKIKQLSKERKRIKGFILNKNGPKLKENLSTLEYLKEVVKGISDEHER